MTQGKKYSYQISQLDNEWCAEILRQVSYKKTVVSKRQDNFKTEGEAQAWAEKELEQFLQQQVERNKRKAEKRSQREEKQSWEQGE
jgi:predicted RNA-binding protein